MRDTMNRVCASARIAAHTHVCRLLADQIRHFIEASDQDAIGSATPDIGYDNDDALGRDNSAREAPMTPVGGPDGPDETPPPPERQYVSLLCLSDAVLRSDTEPTDDENFCFRCLMGKRNHGTSTHLDSLDALMRTQYMHLSPDVLTERVQNMYNTHLRNQIAGADMRKPWRRRVIWEHINVHAKDPEMETKYCLRVMGGALHVLAESGIVYRGATPNALKVDAANLKLFSAMMEKYLRGLAAVSCDAGSGGAVGGRRGNKRGR